MRPEAPPGPEEPVESPADRISDLPDAILGEIISLLPTKDGCRTQVLASRWRTLWRTAPLNLDCRQLSVDDDSELPGAIISSHEGSVQRICIPACYLLDIPCTVAAWLTSRQFDKLQQLEFYHYYSDRLPPRAASVPSPPMPISWFSSSLHTATLTRCHLADNLVQMLRLPVLKKLALVLVDLSVASLHSIIHSSCPALQRLVLVFGLGIHIPCLKIKSSHLVSIGIHFEGQELIIEDAPSLQRLLLNCCYKPSQITVVSAPKLETLGAISDPFEWFEMVFASTPIEVLYIIHVHFCNLHFSFVRIS